MVQDFFNNLDWMMLVKAFVVGGFLCIIGQILIDKTKLTPARILVIFVTAGAILGAKVGIAMGPLGAIAGTIPGAILGGLFGNNLGNNYDNPRCPNCNTKVQIPRSLK